MDVLKTVVYFSLFKYPINRQEILAFSKVKLIEEIDVELADLEEKGIIYNNKGYYCCHDDVSLLNRRLDGNKQAKEVMPKAIKRGKFIAKFPFVEDVCISGSLSKNYFDEQGDVDFFIITKDNRIWLARIILTLFRTIFLLNETKYFCTNYYVSEDSLELDEKNRFTATEIVTLIPIAGSKYIDKFREHNTWITNFFPNVELQKTEKEDDKNTNKLSLFIEKILNTKFGDVLEEKVMKMHLNKWRKQYGTLSKKEFEIAFKSSEKISKSHPKNFQAKVLTLLNERYKEIEKEHDIKLSLEYA